MSVIESNDQGQMVCQGLYQDLEYENMHMESAVKSDRIGIEVNRKVKTYWDVPLSRIY